MSNFIPRNDVTTEYMKELREKAVALALEKAGLNASNAVIRSLVIGSSTSTDFHDLTYATEATAGQEEWIIDGAALTAGDLKNIISTTSGKQVSQISDNTAVVFYGVSDFSGSQDLTAVQFEKGASKIDFWNVQQMYGNDNKIGVGDNMVWYGPDDTVKLNFGLRAGASVVTGEDYQWMLLNVLVEPKSKSAAAAQ